MSRKSDYAVSLFQDGFNCSQSVFCTFCEKYGISQKDALKLACGFGGGMRCGEVCGAVSGAVMVIGLKYGQYDRHDVERKQECYRKTVEFTDAFKEKNNSIICKSILECDISDPAGMEEAKQKGLFQTTCNQMITDAVELLEKFNY